MTGRGPVVAAMLATLAIALGAGAQPARRPFDPHDLHDERYQRPAPAPPPVPEPPRPSRGPGGASQPEQAATPTSGPDHGMPAGWKFTLPQGDAARGRDVFTKLECFACHEVQGQAFPGLRAGSTIGPELTRMAAHHDAEFFAEAIVNPTAVIHEPEWRAADGTSKMPSFNDSITVQELIDLVAFLKSLAPSAGATSSEHRH